MPNANSTITYSDLNDQILSYIISYADNIDESPSSSVSSGYSSVVASVQGGASSRGPGIVTIECIKRSSSGYVSNVSSSTLRSLLNSFLSSRGIAAGKVVSTSGILYYMTSMAIFLERQLHFLGGSNTKYRETLSSTSSSKPSFEYSEGDLSAETVTAALNNLVNSIASSSRASHVDYSYSISSCSSSTSCSYIVYYKL